MHLSKFTLDNETGHPRFLEECRTFLDLPQFLQDLVLSHVLCPARGHIVDPDADTTLQYRPLCINQEIYFHWWSVFLHLNSWSVKMVMTELRSRFNEFKSLRPLIQKNFKPPDGVTLGYSENTLEVDEIILAFEVAHNVTLREVRVSILLLVLYTSDVVGARNIKIRLCCTCHDMLKSHSKEHVLRLKELRNKVATALMDVAFFGNHGAAPDIWIDGLFEVVEVKENVRSTREEMVDQIPELASELTYDHVRGHFRLNKLHRKDLKYWSGWGTNRTGCEFHNIDQFFPFRTSALNTLYSVLGLLENRDYESATDC